AAADRIIGRRHDDRYRGGSFLRGADHRRLAGHDDVHLALHHLRRPLGEAADLAAPEPPFDRAVAPLDVTQLAHGQREPPEAAAEAADFERLGARRQRHESHAPTALLLREGARPRADRRKCDRRNECASVHHSITPSARRTRPAGTSYPSAFAALRLITS